ncbi:MAG: FG-GAP-like repeat-containing protein, partial [Actinobacteria bacterium]|nr:FG-GAP-like repeat-containing protein [Actinomycetota bacterium]
DFPAATENEPRTAVIDPSGNYAYFGATRTDVPPTPTDYGLLRPVAVVKVAVRRPPNPALVADNDAYATDYQTPLTVAAPGVLDGDTNAGGQPMVAGQASDPAGGSVALNPDGSFTYTPDAGFAGADTFTYTASDGRDYSAPATVTLTVASPQGLTGRAFGYHASNITLFGGAQPDTGPTPAVTLAPDGSNSPQTATAATGKVAYGPANVFTSGPIDVATSGSVGGPVNASVSINGLNTSRSEILGEDNYDCCDATGQVVATPTPRPLTNVAATCSASGTGASGSTAITNGWLYLDSGWSDGDATYPEAAADAGGLAEHDPVKVALPTNPAPNTTYTGHIHLSAGSTDDYKVVFNEQIRNPNGSLTVNAVHQYLGTDPPDVLTGQLILGQVVCGAPAGVGAALRHVVADFNGDASTDVAVFRPSDGTWYAQGSAPLAYGTTGDIAVPGDYDGDGKADIAVFRPSNGVWYIHASTAGDSAIAYGANGDVPVPGDYDGDGKTDIAVFRPSEGVWYIHNSAGPDTAIGYGANGDIAVPADYDGDGKTDIAVFRPAQGVWYIHASTAGDSAIGYGATGDVPAVGDYDGDGHADVAVFRPSEGAWYIHNSTGSDTAVGYGASGDVPVPGDYNGDGKTDIAVFRPSAGVWFVQGGPAAAWGTNGDVALPLPAAARGALR